MESLSRCIYLIYSTAISYKLLKSFNQINLNFIWRNTPHYIKKSNMIKDINAGGLKVIDLDCLNGVVKVNWLKSWIKHHSSFWYCIPNFLFSQLGGLNLLLISDCEVIKLPVALSELHKPILLCWKMIYSHHFSPHSTIIWNNRYVSHHNKSLPLKVWFEKKRLVCDPFVGWQWYLTELWSFSENTISTPILYSFHVYLMLFPKNLYLWPKT